MTYITRADVMSWGRVVRRSHSVAAPQFRSELPALLQEHPGSHILAIGMQRSYGDSIFNSKGGLVSMTRLNRFIEFDLNNGRLRAEAGVLLDDILTLTVPRGFFVPVTPGTRFVSLGGAIANDVHGKNHHRAGTFGRHVTRLGLLRSNGERLEVDPNSDGELFAATVGGLGLTGIIEWAEFRLAPIESASLDTEILPFGSLDEFWDLNATSVESHEHTVAWIDCTSNGKGSERGIYTRANWSAEGKLSPHASQQRLHVPMEAPVCVFGKRSVAALNQLYYMAQKRKAGFQHQHYSDFFYPLDAVSHWNRLYGRSGFWQYQCALPPQNMRDGIKALLDEIATSGQGSPLAVLKTFGNVPSGGLLSFPMEGATLALDFPNCGEATMKLFARLDAIVREGNGRLYPAKDGRLPREMFTKGYPQIARFVDNIDPKFASDFWRRVAP